MHNKSININTCNQLLPLKLNHSHKNILIVISYSDMFDRVSWIFKVLINSIIVEKDMTFQVFIHFTNHDILLILFFVLLFLAG